MKKYLFLSLVAMGLLASCADEDFLGLGAYDGESIAFSTQTGEETRSASMLTSIEKFTVTAINADGSSYFNEEEYVYNSSANVFSSATPHYWPLDGTLSFFAINEPGTVNYGTDGVPTYTYSAWAGETDLVAATVRSGEKTIPYPMTFKHITSQIRITATPENETEELTYVLKAVRMTAPSTGTYCFADTTGGSGSWTTDNDAVKTYSYAEGIGSGLSCKQDSAISLPGTYWNILPTQTGTLSFEVEYQVLENGKVISDFTGDNKKTCAVTAPQLMMGKMYTYNFMLSLGSDDVITFTTSFSDWVDGGTTDAQDVTYSIKNVVAYYGLTIPSTTKEIPIKYDAVTTYTDKASNVKGQRRAAAQQSATTMYTTATVGENTSLSAVTRSGSVSWNGATGAWTAKQAAAVSAYEYVDLGLTSGTIWATCNVGASKPEEYGNYYALGETEPKPFYSQETYKWYDSESSSYTKYTGTYTIESTDDPATVNMGSDWCMATLEQWKELISNCTWQWVTSYNGTGVAGDLFTSKYNKKTLFLPATGTCNASYDTQPYGMGLCGFYFASDGSYKTNSINMYTGKPSGVIMSTDKNSNHTGNPVRAVRVEHTPRTYATSFTLNASSITISPNETYQLSVESWTPSDATEKDLTWSSSSSAVTVDETGKVKGIEHGSATITAKTVNGVSAKVLVYVNVPVSQLNANGYSYVDLDLPSGRLWATTNLGASDQYSNGLYFAWGEKTGYASDSGHDFSWANYKYCNGTNKTLTKYNGLSTYGKVDNLMELEVDDDAAHVIMGGDWRIPTSDDFKELYDNAEWNIVTDPSGNQIFKFWSKKDSNKCMYLKGGGIYSGTTFTEVIQPYYWARSRQTTYPQTANMLKWDHYFYEGQGSRCEGYNIRAVL